MSEELEQEISEPVAEFEILAKEFAALLIASDIDEENQKILIDSLAYLTLEEIIDLIGILEAKYVVGETESLDSALVKKLQQTADAFIGEEEKIDAETVKKIESLIDSL